MYYLFFIIFLREETAMLFWALLLVLAIIAYALLIVWVLPKLILKSKYPVSKPTDRGLKKYKLGDTDYAIVYEPSLSARKHITQYVLANKDGKKTFKCKIAPHVTYIDFDIVLFDATDKCFLAINSMEIMGTDRLAPEIDLPSQTAYVSIIINQVNETKLQKKRVATVSKRRIAGFGISALFLSIGISIVSLFAFSNIFGGLFRETFEEKMITSGWIFLLPALVCTACIAGACYILSLRNTKG